MRVVTNNYINYTKEMQQRCKLAIDHLQDRFNALRSGVANPAIFDILKVECYGVISPLTTLARVVAVDKRNIIISPYDPTIIKEIERTLQRSSIGLTPVIEGKQIRLVVPPLTEERREYLVVEAKAIAEEQRVSIRNIRRDTLKAYKPTTDDEKKKFETAVEGVTRGALNQVEELLKVKTDSLMDVDNRWKPDTKARKR